jgi:acetyl-CoA acetyltransferase
MIKQDKHLGLASLCIGGGMGTAVVIKRKWGKINEIKR